MYGNLSEYVLPFSFFTHFVAFSELSPVPLHLSGNVDSISEHSTLSEV